MKNVEEGHVGILIWKSDGEKASWEYCIAKHVYDNKIDFMRENDNSYMHVLNKDGEGIISNQPTESELQMLYKNGEPVTAKKKWNGKWKFEIDKSKWS